MNISLWFRQDKKLVIETQSTQDDRKSYEFPWEALKCLGCFNQAAFEELCAEDHSFNFHKQMSSDRVRVGHIPTTQLPPGEKAS